MSNIDLQLQIIKKNSNRCKICKLGPIVLDIEADRLNGMTYKGISDKYNVVGETVRTHINLCIPDRIHLNKQLKSLISNNTKVYEKNVKHMAKVITDMIPSNTKEDVIEVTITPSQYNLFLKYVDEQSKKEDNKSMVDRTDSILKKLEKVLDSFDLNLDNVNNLTKLTNAARGIIDVLAKLKGEYQDVINHPFVIQLMDQITTISATCPNCKPKIREVIINIKP